MSLKTVVMLANVPLKFNNSINIFLINPNIILYFCEPLDIREY